MEWTEYKNKIILECKLNNKSAAYTNGFLSYAENLFLKNVPVISSPKHFSMLVGVDHQYVCNMAYGTNKFYRRFSIPKKNGKYRKIDEPLPDLKKVQNWILNNILNNCAVSDYAKAYVKGRTIKHNAKFHRAQKVVVTLDIKDFFPSIKIKDIVSIFESIGYYHDLSCFLAHLCCLNNKLPQGAPTSPYLSNLRLRHLDDIISTYTSERKIRYTRYADDLTFSGDFNPHILIKDISKYVYNDGFIINSDKTRVNHKNSRQEITGIIVNSFMQIPKDQRKKIRQEMYYINKFGLESHLERIGEIRSHYINHLMGKINFALFVNPNDLEMKSYFDELIDIKRNFSLVN